MVYQPSPPPLRRVYHRRYPFMHIANSIFGSRAAARLGFDAIDNDFHLSKYGEEWINEHGAPSRFWFAKGDRPEKHPAKEILGRTRKSGGRTFKLRSLEQALRDNKVNGIDTEIEVKNVSPWGTPVIFKERMAEIAQTAEEVYGHGWRKHVIVKVLTTHPDGVEYALRVCTAAHAYRIPTMVLARGKAKYLHFLGHTEVTYVRGSKVIKRRRRA